jgi:hypothetical protein
MLPPEPAQPQPDALQLEQVSEAELRQWLVDDGSLIYGEFQRYELENYFDAIAPYVTPGGEMIDLGSGLGKVVMSAALALPFARCTGVELLGYRHAMATERRARLLARAGELLAGCSGDCSRMPRWRCPAATPPRCAICWNWTRASRCASKTCSRPTSAAPAWCSSTAPASRR